MGLFDNKYPYTDFHELNLDWIISKVDELNSNLDDLEERVKASVLASAKEYIDEQMVDINAQFTALKAEFTALESEVNTKLASMDSKYSAFTNQIQAQITLMNQRISDFEDKIDAEIIGVNARTDLAIEQNNVKLLEQMETYLANIKVVNYFTGAKITVQKMFDFLCTLHADNAITFTELAGKDKTYTELAALNITYTQLAFNGKILIV